MKKTLAVLLALLMLLAMLTGCGASAPQKESIAAESYNYKDSFDYAVPEAPMMEEAETEYVEFSASSTATADQAMAVEEMETYAEKIIYSGNVYMETTKFDQTISELDQVIKSYGGFVQESRINGNTRYNSDGSTTVVDRWGYYLVRIPTAQFDDFMNLANGMGNVTNSSRTAENVTSQYTDYEARLTSLYTQEERLLDMLEKSGDLESLIQLEARLSEVRYEIESIERNLRNLDQRLAYSSVSVELREVEIYTPTVPVQRTFGEKLADAFADGWSGFVRGCQNFLIGLAESLPGLVLFAAIVAAAVLVGKRLLRRRKAKKAKAAEQTQKEAE